MQKNFFANRYSKLPSNPPALKIALKSIENAMIMPVNQALTDEREVHLALRQSPASKALRYIFTAERAAANPTLIHGIKTEPIKEISVVGGGLMGSGIIASLLMAGYPVILLERDSFGLQAGKARIESLIMGAERRGKLPSASTTLQKLTLDTDYRIASQSELIIEAAFEDLTVKQEIFADLDKIMPETTIFATNSSYLNPEKIFQNISNQERCLGLHFFNPAHIMKLLEIIRLEKTTTKTLTATFQLARKLKKTAVLAGVCDGFIGNRILKAYRRQADYILQDGASPAQIDTAMEEFGMSLGPYKSQDLSGLQIAWANRKAQPHPAKQRYVDIADQLCKNEYFGQKSGKGWYYYQSGDKTPHNDNEIAAIIAKSRAEAGITARKFSNEEISETILAAIVNEGAHILGEKIAARPLVIDTVWVNGYGLARWRGGIMHYADHVGLENIVQIMQKLQKQSPDSWQIAPLLIELTKAGKKFADLN